MRRLLLAGPSWSVIAPRDLQHRRVTVVENSNEADMMDRAKPAKPASFGIDPKKLDLALNLDKADFAAMVKATRFAIVQEKRAKRNEPIGDISLDGDLATTENSPTPAETIVRAFSASEEKSMSESRASRTIRGIVGAGAVHDSNSLRAVEQQRAAEGNRYGLMDALRDCVLAGNWAKAMHLFDGAIELACKGESFEIQKRETPKNSTSSGEMNSGENDLHEALEVLRRIKATTPPDALAQNMSVRPGILRWGGGHFYLLLKLLLSRHRVEEAERVWDVMKRIGFTTYQMDARLVNQFIALARRNTAPDLVTPLKHTKEHEDREKAFRRAFVVELEELAEKKELSLNDRSKRAAMAARFAGSTKADPTELDGEGLRIGDFSGLLRRSTSEESTTRILQMMEKVGTVRDGRTYASLIAALRQPGYRLDATADSGDGSCTKEEYDSHRRCRLARARQWFDECPKSELCADVYNELLSLTRGGAEEDEEFYRLLTEFRGASLPRPIVSAESMENKSGGDVKEEAPPAIAPPHWSVPPNGRTYEILLLRCRYLHDWPTLWALYDEMLEWRVKGTPRVFEVILEVAQQHPPRNRDPNSVVLELYSDMKKQGMDVTGIKSTISVVNAWSATRRRRRF